MEFMYCIPDLEVFIDKTIKKCLLEYDLDANDTEAVLDDMEKAWPKSPPKSPEKNATDDCKGNTEKGRGGLDQFGSNQIPETTVSNMSEDAAETKGHQSVLASNSSQSEPLQGTSHRLVKSPPGGGDCSRSDTSSPDAADGHLQKQKHPKLKSRLQQRYFEGSKASSLQTWSAAQEPDEEVLNDSCDAGALAPNNLHLLASAANLHTKRSIGSRVPVAEANRYSKERAVRRTNPATKSFSKGPRSELEFFRDTPVLPRLMPPLPSTSRSDVYNRQDFNSAAGPHHLQGVVAKKEKSHTIQPALGFHDSKEVIYSGTRLLSSKHTYLPQKEKAKCNQTAPSSNLKAHRKHGLPAGTSVQGVDCSDEGIGSKARPQDNSCSSPVNEEKAKRLLEHYQNGYHSLIPRDVRKGLSPGSEKEDGGDVNTRPQLVHGSQNGSLEGKKMKRRLSPSSDVGDYEDKITMKQQSLRLEKEDLEIEKMRQLSSSSENNDFEVKKMRKQLPVFNNEGDAEVLKRHNSTQRDGEVRKRQDLMLIPQSTSSLKSSDQRPVSTLDYYHLATNAGGLEYTHQHPTGLKPGDFFNQHHYYTSRIASIIVEELEKDNKCQDNSSPRETIPFVNKFSPEIALQVGQNDLASRSLKSNSPLPYKSQVGPPQTIKSYNLASPVCDNILKSTPQILPAHIARPSHSSVALLAFHLGHTAKGKDFMATAASFASAQTGFALDDNIQPEDLSIKSNNSVPAQVKPSNSKPCPSDTAVEEHSQGYFSSPTSPVLTSLLSCHTQPSQVLQKPPPSPRHNHKRDVDYNSDGETSVHTFKTVGNWEKKGQVHGLDIPLKGDSKAVEKRRAESLVSWSSPGHGDVRKTRQLQTATKVSGLQR